MKAITNIKEFVRELRSDAEVRQTGCCVDKARLQVPRRVMKQYGERRCEVRQADKPRLR